MLLAALKEPLQVLLESNQQANIEYGFGLRNATLSSSLFI